MERKLASIRVISDISPIEGADSIELATVDGWKVVVAKNVGHKVGDMVVYCEVDSFLPIKPEFEFLRKTSYKKMGETEGFRLKTMTMRKALSQGLIIPLNELLKYGVSADDVYDGLDVSGMLGIVKYEAPIPAQLAGVMKGGFPSFIPKTDEERVQNLTEEYQEWKNSDTRFYVSEKLEGSSFTCYINNGEFGVCSRNLELLDTDTNTLWKVARKLELEQKMLQHGGNFALQGELIGESVQGNIYNLRGQTVRFFNAYDIDLQRSIKLNDFKFLMEYLRLEYVPILDEDFYLPETIKDLLYYSDGKSVLNPKTNREGVVIRSHDMKISFKAISNLYLLNQK
jgi:RNA ligase (TIGR02306 family)